MASSTNWPTRVRSLFTGARAGAARPPIHDRLDHLSGQIARVMEEIQFTQRETRLILGQMTLPAANEWNDGPITEGGAPEPNVFPCSTVCRQESFEGLYYSYWARKLGLPNVYHRKNWEHAFICQALWERGVLRPGARGLGFGVGLEPTPALFASLDCRITATDLASEDEVAAIWRGSSEHGGSLENLPFEGICPKKKFRTNVEFRPCDMNAVPDDLTDYDFCWSSCAFEHLGSLEHGLRFVERAMDCLKPGGLAVHTTEFNLSSNEDTVEGCHLVLYRRRDMEALAARLSARGHHVAPFDFNPGSKQLDAYIDLPPFRQEPHLKLAVAGYATTSIGLIVQKAH